jgi:hypothetical protein
MNGTMSSRRSGEKVFFFLIGGLAITMLLSYSTTKIRTQRRKKVDKRQSLRLLVVEDYLKNVVLQRACAGHLEGKQEGNLSTLTLNLVREEISFIPLNL